MRFREAARACLGGDWPAPCALDLQIRGTTQEAGYRRLTISYQAEVGEPGPECTVSAYLLVPDGACSARKAPAVCVWHQHRGAWHIGAREPAGLDGLAEHHTGVALVREGYVVLCPDAYGFGDRSRGFRQRNGDLERFLFLKYLVEGRSLAWKHVLDMRRAVDLLTSLEEVRADRIGCYGHSMGSTHTWLVGPWEPRLRALCGNCCLPTYAGMHREQILHCFANFIPGLHQHGDTPDLAALIAPRALHLNFGELDPGSPIGDVRRGIETIQQQYQAINASEKFSWFIEPGVGHVLSESMWIRVRDFFAKHLHD